MAELKLPSVSIPASAKADFKAAIGISVPQVTFTKRAKKLSEDEADWIKLFLFASTGHGKTFALAQLALAGYKLYVGSSDFGGNGLITATNLINSVDPSKLDNIVNVDLDNYDEVMEFVDRPSTFFPELYDFDPDFLVWEGFATYQQLILADQIGEDTEGENSKPTDEYQFERRHWGRVRVGTTRPLNRFLVQHNSKTGKHWNKIVTAHKDPIKRTPMLQGSAREFIAAGFDLVVEIIAKNSIMGNDAASRTYEYVTQGNEQVFAKSRGFDLNPVEPADLAKLYEKISVQKKAKAK